VLANIYLNVKNTCKSHNSMFLNATNKLFTFYKFLLVYYGFCRYVCYELMHFVEVIFTTILIFFKNAQVFQLVEAFGN
jgi:hypothetical protein